MLKADLGVEISEDLSWSQHIRSWCSWAGLLEQLIQVPFHCSTIHWWDLYLSTPYQTGIPTSLNTFMQLRTSNAVHRARLALRQKKGEMSYKERCNILNWLLLSTRRTYFSPVECYKIVFGLSHLDFQKFFEFAMHSTRANHSYKLFLKSSKINCFKHAFSLE